MALHSTLPIYKVTYDLLILVNEVTRHMPRDFKPTMGKELRKDCVKLVRRIYKANVAEDKRRDLTKLIERVRCVELSFRASKDLRLITTDQYSRAIELTSSISRQATGWRKSQAKSPVA